MRNFRRTRAHTACVIALVIALAGGCARMWVGPGFPREGEELVEVTGLSGEVRIDYDEWYVPHVRALSERDAMFGLGYAMASARLFQLDLYRRLARGDLAGLTGPEITLRDESGETTLDAVEIDLWLRLLDFADTGRRHLEASSPETKARLAAFADGVNAFARERKGELSAPYSVPGFLGGKHFRLWNAEDSAAIAAMLSFGLSQNLQEEAFAVAALRDGMSIEQILDYISPDVAISPDAYEYIRAFRGRLGGVRFLKGFEHFQRFIAGSRHLTAELSASNNWVVGPSKSASGKPMLANDPHISTSMPPFWFAAHVQSPDWSVAGAFAPGVPVALAGHNGRVAWGVTAVHADTIDLAIEQVDGARKTFVQDGKTYGMTRRTLRARAKDEFVTRDAYATSFGPIISELAPDSTWAVSMRWVGWEGTRVLDAGFGLFGAKSAKDVAALGRDFGSLSLNLVCADVDGHIGWSVTGDIPERTGYTGVLPRDGRTSAQEWTGLMTHDARPGAYDPKSGIIVTANNRPDHASADKITSSYPAPYRHDRIVEKLKAKDKLTLADMRETQSDLHSNQADKLLPIVLGVAPRSPDAQDALATLRSWKKAVRADSPGALYWEVFLDSFQRRLTTQIPEGARGAYLWRDPFGPILADALPREKTVWWGSALERDVMVEDALADAAARLRKMFGARLDTATWGDLHKLYFEHPLAEAKAIGKFYRLPPLPFGGDAATVSSGTYRLGHSFDATNYSSLRFAIDMAAPGEARFAIPGGQSEIGRHPSYANLLLGWYEGGDYPLLHRDEDLSRAAKAATVILKRPAN